MHATVNRNKRSLTLDLRRDAGRALFLRLAERADVVVENFRPGTLDRWGAGYAAVRAVKPDIVFVSISGYGQFGSGSGRLGYDPLAQAASGFLSLNGDPEGEPVKAPTFLADDLAGLHAALATLAALRHRERSGEGQHVDVSLFDSLLFQSNGYLTLGALNVALPRLGNQFRIAAPANTYRCRDGSILAGVLLDSHWKRLAGLLGRPELADDPRFATTAARIARRDEVDRLLRDWCGLRTAVDALAALERAGIPSAPVRTYAETARDPLVAERDMLQCGGPAPDPGVPITGPAAKFSRTPTRVRSAAPALGGHTDEILAELGVSADERRRLREQGVI
jgi:formyl-CoA transferase